MLTCFIFRYFDNSSNGYYYQHSGSQGWKKNVKGPLDLPPYTAPQVPEAEVAVNPLMASNHTSNANHRDREYNNSHHKPGGRPPRRNDEGVHAPPNNTGDWASTSSHRQNGNGRLPPRNGPYRGVNGGGGGGARGNPGDYWRKAEANSAPTSNGVPSSDSAPKPAPVNKSPEEPQQSQNSAQKAYYQRNDRWQSRNPHAPQPLTHAQRKERGPLPDWDEVAKAGTQESFDYMDLMESQYSQYYAMTAVPPFDPNMSAIDPNFAPNYWNQFQQRMFAFQPAYVAQQPPPAANLPPTPQGAVTQPPPPQSTAAENTANSRPESVASSLTSTVPPTPTALLSPNAVPPVIAPLPPMIPAVVPTTGGPLLPPGAVIASFPSIFQPPNPYIAPLDEFKLKEVVRRQM